MGISLKAAGFVFQCDAPGCSARFESGIRPEGIGAMAAARAAGFAIRAARAHGWTREFPTHPDHDDARGIRKTLPAIDRCPIHAADA